MKHRIEITPEAKNSSLSSISLSLSKILKYLTALADLEDPRTRGKELTGNLTGLWRYRVGDYRILCKLEDDLLVILVVDIGHRKEICQ
jgi:mRNA interferase RelE/StbE